jgi:hypothetical protein
MKQFMVYQNYDTQVSIGHVCLDDNISDKLISDCVLGPEIILRADGKIHKIIGFGMFPRVNTDIRDRS